MNKKESVAIFTDSFDQINGVSNTFKQLVSYCRQEEYSLDVHTYGRKRHGLETLGSVRIFRHKPLLAIRYYSDMFWDLGTPRFSLARKAANASYDLIHVASPGSMGLNGLWVAHRNKIPLVGSYHTALPEYVRPRVEIFAGTVGLPVELGARAEAALWRYMQWFYDRCERVLVPSQSTRVALEKRLRVPLTIFSRGVDVDRFHPRFRKQRGRLTVLYVGRVSIEKNLDLLVRLFRHRTDVDLVVVGDGPYRGELRKHLPYATLPGFLAGEELSRAYASADVFLFPSKTDTFGNVVLEAMSSGVPAIVTDQMGPKEIVRHGETGFVAASEWEFRRYLDVLLDRPTLRRTMARKAREYALTQGWNVVFDELLRQYSETIISARLRSHLPLDPASTKSTPREAHEPSLSEVTPAGSH